MDKIRVQVDLGNGEYKDFTTSGLMMSLNGEVTTYSTKDTKSLLIGEVSKSELRNMMAGNIQSFFRAYAEAGLSPIRCIEELNLAATLAVRGLAEEQATSATHSPKEKLEEILKELLKDLQNSK